MSNAARGVYRKRQSAVEIEQRAEREDVPFMPETIPGKQPRRFSHSDLIKMHRYESVNTYEPQTTIHKDHLEYRSREPRWFIWVFVVIVGALTALGAVLMISCLHVLFAVRMRLLQVGLMGFSFSELPPIYDNDAAAVTPASVFSGADVHLYGLPKRNYGGGMVVWVVFSLLMSTAASLICALVPEAIGPGSPEVFAYLNGVANPSFSDPKVFVAKMFATLFTVAAGVPLGTYGTLAQSGTAIATLLLTRSKWIRFDSIRIISCFRNPRDERIITVIGAASGVASAFSVSIGGLMMIMEQLSTIFPVRFMLYVFVACLVSSLSLETYFSYLSYFGARDRSTFDPGQLLSEVLIQFDTRIRGVAPAQMNVLLFLPAIIIGVICGLLSVGFIRLHGFAINCRRRMELKSRSKKWRYVLPVLVSVIYAASTFWIAVSFGDSVESSGYGCQELTPNGTILTTRASSVVGYYGATGILCSPYVVNESSGQVVPPNELPYIVVNYIADSSASSGGGATVSGFTAPPVFHVYASLAFGYSDSTLQFLLSWRTPDVLPVGVVVLFGLLYYLFSGFLSGIALTGDVMLPALVVGGCVGRLVGVAIYHLWNLVVDTPLSETWTDPGVFALLGAGCFFGGVTGMTFSICVILTEITSDFRHVLPLMLGISIAKRISERFAHNINATYLEDHCVPLLDFDARVHKYDMFCAKHVMTPFVETVHTVTSVEVVLQLLRSCEHHAFPVASVRDGSFKGIVLREQLLLFLWHLYYTDSYTGINSEQIQRVQDQLFYEGEENQLPPFEDFRLQDRIDLSAHIDQSGFCVLDTTSLSRTYHLFRTLGLRHLVVVNKDNRIVGIVTRKDLVSHCILQKITEENTQRRRQLQEQRRRARELGLRHDNDSGDDDDVEEEEVMDRNGDERRGAVQATANGEEKWKSTKSSASPSSKGYGATAPNIRQPQEWIVVDEGDENDAVQWEGGGLGPMHPVMVVTTADGGVAEYRSSKAVTSSRDLNASFNNNGSSSFAGSARFVAVGRGAPPPDSSSFIVGGGTGGSTGATGSNRRLSAILRNVPSIGADVDAAVTGGTSSAWQMAQNSSMDGAQSFTTGTSSFVAATTTLEPSEAKKFFRILRATSSTRSAGGDPDSELAAVAAVGKSTTNNNPTLASSTSTTDSPTTGAPAAHPVDAATAVDGVMSSPDDTSAPVRFLPTRSCEEMAHREPREDQHSGGSGDDSS